MSLSFHCLSPIYPSSSSSSSSSLYFTRNPCLALRFVSNPFPNTPNFHILKHKLQIQTPFNFESILKNRFCARVSLSSGGGGISRRDSDVGDFNFDSFLSVAEIFCLVSSLLGSVGFALNCVIASSKSVVLAVFGDRVLVGAFVFLVVGVVIGAWIRRRKWDRIYRETVKGVLEVNLVERIDKLEEDLRASATLIRVLSRQLEKLGIRFRVTRKALKKPIEETAALAQKTSEATRTLAVQEDILEKELGEIQKVLLAMQEQQQKQLDLILAIGKSGKLWESRQEYSQGQSPPGTKDSFNESIKQKEVHEI